MKLSKTIANSSTTLSSTTRLNRVSRTLRIAPAVAVVIGILGSLFGAQTSSSPNSVSTARAKLSNAFSIQAAGRGNPWINMSDGHDLLAAYEGSEEAVRTMSREQGRPLSLATADFDEDGMPDLITGYADSRGGVITLQRGNVDSVFPNTPDARQRKASGSFTDVPFLSPARVFEIAPVPELLLAGDFNADGHADLMAAARGDVTMHFLAGDGHGSFEAAQDISLPGRVSALTSGEINRADGLTDLVVAIDAADGPKLMIFEGPEGALKAKPEVLSLPRAATALALGYLDEDSAGDLAVAAGNELLIVHGRDRKLSLDEEDKAAVPEALISSRSFQSSLTSLAIGDFTGDSNLDLAVLLEDGSVQLLNQQGVQNTSVKTLSSAPHWEAKTLARGLRTHGGSLFCARVSSLSHENLVMIDRESKQLHIWMDDEERQGRGDLTLESSSGQPSGPATFDIGDEPEAVLPMRLNNDALSDLVVLSAGRMSPSVVRTLSNTPIIVCTLQDCTNCGSFRDAVAAANSTPGLDAIRFSNQFSGVPTINLSSPLTIGEAVTVDGAATGSCSNGAQADVHADALNAMGLDGGNSTTSALIITQGGSDIVNFVVGRFTNFGLQVTTNGGNIIEGNFIGLASNGTTSRGNGTGLRVTSRANTVGGTSNFASNVISSNGSGVAFDGANAQDNNLRLNLIGTDASGNNLSGNQQSGVLITNGASRNVIGGSIQNTANLIAGNRDGVGIASGTGNLIQRNQLISNTRDGVLMNSAGNTVGGTTDITINGVWFNGSNGVEMSGSVASDNQVQRNYIGLNFDTSGNPLDRGNAANGVALTGNAFRNTIGGALDAAGNFIALNTANGVLVSSGNQNKILSNRIFNNGDIRIRLESGANDNQVPPMLVSATLTGTSANKVVPAAATLAAQTLTVTMSLTGTPNQTYTLDLYLYSMCECTGKQTICLTPFPLGQRNAPMDSTGQFSGAFTFNVPPPDNFTSFGFVNATATSPPGSTSQFAQCVQIGAATSCAPICPASPAPAQATSASGAMVSYQAATLPANCSGVNVACAPASGSTFPVGTTTVTCTASDASGTRGACSFTVTVTPPPAGPTITSACKGDGKQLIVNGSGFVDGAKVTINGDAEKKTQFVSSTQVIAFKAGKRTFTGDILTVRNPGSVETPGFSYTRVNCQ